MGKYFKYIILFTSSIFLLLSCQEGREAGDLWGQWRMDGGDRLYISFSGHIARLQDTHYAGLFVYGNFQHEGDSLFLQCYSAEGEAKDTVMVEEAFGFKPFNNIRMKIEKLDADNLVFSKDGFTWSFSIH
jgi:hypothetical protein